MTLLATLSAALPVTHGGAVALAAIAFDALLCLFVVCVDLADARRHRAGRLLDGVRYDAFPLRYRPRAPFPHEIEVNGIDALPLENDLPDWEDLRGRAPDATGDLSSEAFVRGLRDAW